jgi:hypothetical protein
MRSLDRVRECCKPASGSGIIAKKRARCSSLAWRRSLATHPPVGHGELNVIVDRRLFRRPCRLCWSSADSEGHTHDLPQIAGIKIDGTVLLFTLAVSLLTGLFFGTVPAIQAASGNFNPALTETGRGSSASRAGKKVRSTLLIAEIAIALVLVTTSGLMIRSMMNAVKVDPGFRVDHLLALDVVLSPTKYVREDEKSMFFTQAVQRLRDLPGVQAASAAIFPPLTGYNDTAFMLADHAVESSMICRPLPPISLFLATSKRYVYL